MRKKIVGTVKSTSNYCPPPDRLFLSRSSPSMSAGENEPAAPPRWKLFVIMEKINRPFNRSVIISRRLT